MASIFKRKKYAVLPDGASVVEVTSKGVSRRVAKWKEDGRDREAEVDNDPRFGDRIVVSESKRWYVSYETDAGRRQVRGYTDKAATLALGERLEKEAARRKEGLIDQVDEHMKTPIGQHLDDFMATRLSSSTSDLYVVQVRRRIQRIIDGIKASRLHELDSVAIDRFLSEQKLFGYARNEYIGNIKTFTKWAVEIGRLRTDPLISLRKIPRKKIKAVHPRRALSTNELARLLKAAEERPLLEKRIVRTGKNRGQASANVHPRVLAKMTRLGQERTLCYLLAAWAGLRRSEVRQLRWGDIYLENQPPQIRLRSEATKAKRADNLYIHPELQTALRSARPIDAKPQDRIVKSVPDMKAFRADLKQAGIEAEDANGRFVDFHSLRKSLNMLMAVAKVSQRVRQQQMRHSDPRLTEMTYIDELLLPIVSEMEGIAWISPTKPIVEPKSAPPGAPRAPLMHRKIDVWRLELAQVGTETSEACTTLIISGSASQMLQIQAVVEAMAGNKATRHDEVPGLEGSG